MNSNKIEKLDIGQNYSALYYRIVSLKPYQNSLKCNHRAISQLNLIKIFLKLEKFQYLGRFRIYYNIWSEAWYYIYYVKISSY